MVFYRKYRPQKINDLDSQDVRNILSSVFQGKTVPHAFLFTGPKGLGKTSTARIIAKILNCEKINDYSLRKLKSKSKDVNQKSETKTIEPCNKCNQCLSITNGSNIDVLEIDGASNRGIDEIRDLREKIKLSPALALKKVYIIDEVHMLTTEAFNALLKTLEEPPDHAVFVLCTTEQHKVPETIIDRCFRISFKKATNEELIRSFKRIIALEKITIEEDALLEIAKLSDGSFRDGTKILEEISSIAKNKKITKEFLEEKYQVLSIDKRVLELLKFLEEKNGKKALELISKLVKEGIEIRYFIEQLINKLHEELLIQTQVLTDKKLLTIFTVDENCRIIEILIKANSRIKHAVLPQLPLELAILEWTGSNPPAGKKEEVIKRISVNEEKLSKKEIDEVGKETANFLNKTSDFWQNLIEKVKPYNHSVAGLLRGCILVAMDDKKVIVETSYKFHKEKLDELKTRNAIEKAVEELTGNKLILSTILKEKRG